MDMIAEQTLVALYPDGKNALITLRIGRPTARNSADWVCPVDADGLLLWQGPTEFSGVSSWHALMIGLRFLRSMLSLEVERGAILHREDGEHALNVDELFVMHEIG